MADEGGYRERRLHRRRAWLVGLAVAVVVLVVAAMRTQVEGPCAAPREAPSAELALMPTGLSFDRIGTVTRVREEAPHVTVQAVTTTPADAATVLIQDAVVAAGYRP